MQEQKLKHQIEQLKSTIDIQKSHIKYLNQKLRREEKSKQSFNELLKDLHSKNLLNAENLQNLQVFKSSCILIY